MCDPSYKSLLFKVRDILGDSFRADEFRDAVSIAIRRDEYNGNRDRFAELIAEEIKRARGVKV